MVTKSCKCGVCGLEIDPNSTECPKCGGKRKDFVVEVKAILGFSNPEIRGTVKDKTGKKVTKFFKKEKISALGKKAKEELHIDKRSDRKYHHVEEKDENGDWKVVHHEDESLKEANERKKHSPAP